MTSNRFFETERPVKLYLRIAIPGMLSMLAMSVYSVLEGIFIGQFLGEMAFAAVNIAFPLVLINFSVSDMVGVGATVPISISLGKKDNEKANNYFTCSVILILICAFLLGVVMYIFAPALVRVMGAEGTFGELAVKYIRVYAILSPATALVFAMDNFLRVCGIVKGSLALNVFMSLLTIALLFLFIVVFKMDVEGSALAASLSMSFCAIIAISPFVGNKMLLKFKKPKFSFTLIKEIVSCGAPVFINNMAGRVAAIVMNIVLLDLGGQTAVATYSVLMYASEIIQPMLYGMSDSTAPAVGYNWGAGKLKRVSDLAKCTFAACFAVSLLGTAVMYFLPREVSSLFIDKSETVLLDMCTDAMKVFCFAYVFRWFSFVAQGFFSALEKPVHASVISISSALVFPVLFIYLLKPMGLTGIWLNLAASCVAVGVVAGILLIKFQKKMPDEFLKHQARKL